MPSIDVVQTLVAIGRLLLGALFVIGGARHFGKLDEIAACATANGHCTVVIDGSASVSVGVDTASDSSSSAPAPTPTKSK